MDEAVCCQARNSRVVGPKEMSIILEPNRRLANNFGGEVDIAGDANNAKFYQSRALFTLEGRDDCTRKTVYSFEIIDF